MARRPRLFLRAEAVVGAYMPIFQLPVFLRRKFVYQQRLRRFSHETEFSDVQRIVRALRRDGAVLVPDFMSDETVRGMRESIPSSSTFDEDREGSRTLHYRNAEGLEALSAFFEHPTVRAVAEVYISSQAIPLWRTIDLKVAQGNFLTFERFPHIDTWKRRLKAFLFLEDVGPENAPIWYLRGSHRGLWRTPFEARIANQYLTNAEGHALPESYYVGMLLAARSAATEGGVQL